MAAGDVLAVVDRSADGGEPDERRRSPRSEERQRCARQVAQAGRRSTAASTSPQQARSGGKTTDLWLEIGKNGYLGINIPEEYGGGGGGIGDIAAVCEELAAQGCPLLMMVGQPGDLRHRDQPLGTEEQKQRWLPGIADGTGTMAFAITEPDAGTNSHNITTTARRRDGDDWVLNGRKIYISGVDEADNVLVVARTEDAEDRQAQALPVRGADRRRGLRVRRRSRWRSSAPRSSSRSSSTTSGCPPTRWSATRTPAWCSCSPGSTRSGSWRRRSPPGLARFALDKAAAYAKERDGLQGPIGAHQAIAHPLAQSHIEIELARLMTQKAAALYDAGDDMGAGEAANMAKYAAAEAACDAADRAVQAHGGNGITQEYGMAGLLVAARAGRIAPVSREMILNFVAMHSLGLPKSY